MAGDTLEQLPEWAAELLASERVARLGLIDEAGRPRVLPITFALHEGAVWSVIDNKPKRAGAEPARIRWLRRRPQAVVTVDHYEDDWAKLAWVQLIGVVTVLDPDDHKLAPLIERYPQYRHNPPPGPLLRLAITRTVCWRASGG